MSKRGRSCIMVKHNRDGNRGEVFMFKIDVLDDKVKKELIELLYLEFKMEWGGVKIRIQNHQEKRELFENLSDSLKNEIIFESNRMIEEEYGIDLTRINSLFG